MAGAMRYTIRSLAVFGATVAGIKHSYDLDTSFGLEAIPQQLNDTMLPVLTPVFEGENDLGYQTLALMGNSPQDSFEIRHVLFFKPEANLKYQSVLGGLLNIRDAYVTAAQTQKFLDTQASPTNQVVMNFKAQIVTATWGDVPYWGMRFTHSYDVYL